MAQVLRGTPFGRVEVEGDVPGSDHGEHLPIRRIGHFEGRTVGKYQIRAVGSAPEQIETHELSDIARARPGGHGFEGALLYEPAQPRR